MTEAKPFWLQGNFAPVDRELSATDLPVLEGALPPELTGLYARNGANPPSGSSLHWFLGEGMIHGVRLENGRAAWYRNRYVQTPYLTNPGAPRTGPEGPDHTVSLANTHVIRHAGRIMALEEGSFPYVLDDQLETVGPWDFDGRLDSAMTAHPKVCPETGEMLFFGYSGVPPYLVYHRADASGRLVQSEEITMGGPTMVHDFAVTRSRALFLDLPVVFDANALGMPFHWDDDYPARIGIMPRDGRDADVVWFEVEPCYIFHGLNAYDDGDRVVFDACRSSEVFRSDAELAGGQLTLRRFVFDLASGAVKEEDLDDRAMEFPRVADAAVGLPHRFGFLLELGAGEGGAPGLAGVVKQDLARGRTERHDFGPGRVASEPCFVPAEGADPFGDEGYVLTYVFDEGRQGSELVVLDASALAKPPIARIELPQRVPFGFHGSWLPDPQ